MTLLTSEQLQNAAIDVATIANVINGEGQVISRTGTVIDSLKKVISEVRRANSAYSFETLAELNAAGTPQQIANTTGAAADIMCRVWNDPLADNNGLYGWKDAWVKSVFDPSVVSRSIESIATASFQNYQELLSVLGESKKVVFNSGVSPVSSWSSSLGFQGYGYSFSFDETKTIDGIIVSIESNNASTLKVNIYERKNTLANSGPPPELKDSLLQSRTHNVADLDGPWPTMADVELPFTELCRVGYYYIVTVEAFDSTGTPCAIGTSYNNVNISNKTLRGYYINELGNWVGTNASYSVHSQPYVKSIGDITQELAQIQQNADDIISANEAISTQGEEFANKTQGIDDEIGLMSARQEDITSNLGEVKLTRYNENESTTGQWTEANNFKGYGYGFKLDSPYIIDGIKIQVVSTAATKLRFEFYERLLQDVAGDYPPLAGDKLIHSEDIAVAALGGPWAVMTEIELPVRYACAADKYYIAKVSALDNADAPVSIGTVYNGRTGTEQSLKGYYLHSNGTWRDLGAANTMAHVLPFTTSVANIASKIEQLENNVENLATSKRVHQQYSAIVTSNILDLEIAAQTISSHSGDIAISEQTVSVTAPSSTTETARVSLVYDNNALYANSNEFLPYNHISDVTVTRVSDGATLTEGVDYAVYYTGAKIYGLVDVPDFDVDITYTGLLSRYDVVQLDTITGLVSVQAGTDRAFDPEEYIPSISAGKVHLYNALVYGNSIELIPVHPWRGGVFKGTETEVQRLERHNAQALRNFVAKMRSGQNVTIASYGDSITALQTGMPDYLTPNGIYRDRASSYLVEYPADTLANIETFDFGDGEGQVHCKLGWSWRVVELAEKHGCTVTYNNYGVASTNSGNYIDGAKAGGTYPARLSALTGSSPDLVIIGFGMNEIGSNDTATNVAEIVNACKAVGAECIVMGVPRVSSIGGKAERHEWLKTCNALYAAAISSGAAFVSSAYICDDDRIGGMGISSISMCRANIFNHPGIYEMRKYGEALSNIFS